MTVSMMAIPSTSRVAAPAWSVIIRISSSHRLDSFRHYYDDSSSLYM